MHAINVRVQQSVDLAQVTLGLWSRHLVLLCVVVAHSQASSSPSSARSLGIASIVFSVIGVVVGIILIILIIIYLVVGFAWATSLGVSYASVSCTPLYIGLGLPGTALLGNHHGDRFYA